MKLRYFYKIDQNKNPIPASNIRRKSKPSGHQWRELLNSCCSPQTVPCTCDFRYFVQVERGNPVDHTLIKRKTKPTPEEGIFYMEVESSKNQCCGLISWELIRADSTGVAIISDDGHDVVNPVISSTGSFRPIHGSSIGIDIDASIGCADTQGFILSVVSDDLTLNYNSTLDPSYTFVFDATKNYTITLTTTCTPEG